MNRLRIIYGPALYGTEEVTIEVALVVGDGPGGGLYCVPWGRPTAEPIPMPDWPREWDPEDADMPDDCDPEEAEAGRTRWLRTWVAVLHERMPGWGRADQAAYQIYQEWLAAIWLGDGDLAVSPTDAEWEARLNDPARLFELAPSDDDDDARVDEVLDIDLVPPGLTDDQLDDWDRLARAM